MGIAGIAVKAGLRVQIGLIAVLVASMCPVWASMVDPADIIPIKKARLDSDQDGRPDRIGEKVTLTGWVSSDSHSFYNDRFDVFMQDETGGILLRGAAKLTPIGEGQRMIVAGRLRQKKDLFYLDEVELRILPRQLRLLRPVNLNDVSEGDEVPSGELVHFRGEIVSVMDENDGKRVLIDLGRGPSDRVVAFWPNEHRELVDITKFTRGSQLDVDGVLARLGPHAPFNRYMEVWPRTVEDVRVLGFSRTAYLQAWIGLCVALLLCLLYGVSLHTQVKRKTSALRDIQERFQTIYESAADGILVAEVSGKIRSANPATEVITGYPGQVIRTKFFYDLLLGDGKSQWGEVIREHRNENPSPVALTVIREDHSEIQVDVKVSAIELNNKPFFMILMRDVTERRKAAQQLSEEKERLAVTLTSVADGVIATDIEGRVMSMNRAAETLCQIKEEDALKRPLSEVFKLSHKLGDPSVTNPVARVIQKHKTIELPIETRLEQREGMSIPASVICAPMLNAEQRVIGVVIAFADISDRIHAEDELQKATKLESIGTLAGGIAHDFNNIMTSVIGNLSLASTFHDEGQMTELKACIDHAHRSSHRAKSLTSQLLTFSTGGDPVKRTARVPDILQDAANFALSGSSVRVNQVMEENLWPVNVDIHQIVQALSNMLMNSKEACAGSGTITIKARNLRMDTLQGETQLALTPGRYIQIILTDEGEGIPEEVVKKIFDPYFTTKSNGSGLGLTATYSIIKNHAGLVEVDSELGKGATFTIYLPASDKNIEKVIKPKTALVSGTGRILIMDDEKAIRRVAAYMLKKMGFESDGAESGEEAIEMYVKARDEGNPYTALLMDLTIPGGMGGKDAIEKLLELDPNVKAIVSSGYSTDPVMSQYEKHGFIGVVAKPYSIQELGLALEDALNVDAKIPAA